MPAGARACSTAGGSRCGKPWLSTATSTVSTPWAPTDRSPTCCSPGCETPASAAVGGRCSPSVMGARGTPAPLARARAESGIAPLRNDAVWREVVAQWPGSAMSEPAVLEDARLRSVRAALHASNARERQLRRKLAKGSAIFRRKGYSRHGLSDHHDYYRPRPPPALRASVRQASRDASFSIRAVCLALSALR